ncbi:hypothetical protein [Rhodoblastus acidophilus]|uniref:hypothetical protein n=1 Tax=Rhodoblastus acidophilus TaxID=1074 RepID=UPI000DABAE4C|nr:hypothetical protein [Rhodoblastus acidophilus]RAI17991.1 hypothetical protein CH337_15275 [Rhodoblastus acidophilus]
MLYIIETPHFSAASCRSCGYKAIHQTDGIGATHLLARHRMSSGSTLPMAAYFKLEDFRARLDPDANSPYLDKSLKGEKALQRHLLIRDELAFNDIRQLAKKKRYPDDQVYIDMMPVFVSAVSRVFTQLDKIGAKFKGFDAATYKAPFISELKLELTSIDHRTLNVKSMAELNAASLKLRN